MNSPSTRFLPLLPWLGLVSLVAALDVFATATPAAPATPPVAHQAPAAPALVITPADADGIYPLGARVGWSVRAPEGWGQPLKYTLKKNHLDVVQSGVLAFEGGVADVGATLEEPGMLYLEVLPEGGVPEQRRFAAAAVAPEQLQPVATRPADFDAFWAAKIGGLHATPAEPVLTPGESGREGVDYATLVMKHVGGVRIYGQLAKPAREGKFPALLLLQWAGGPYPLEKAWVTDRAAEGFLALNVMPHDVPADLPPAFYQALPQLIRSYNTIYDEDRDRNYFLQMYLAAYRAADYLTERPDWDGRVLVVTGTSMGGQQSFAVAGLHPRVTHMVVHVPAGADALGALHGRLSGYPFWDVKRPRVVDTAPYFDAINFASRIRATCLVSMGFLDEVCPPVGIWTAFNQIPGRKLAVPLVESAHNHQSPPEVQVAYTDRAAAWLRQLGAGAEPELR